MWFDLLFVSSTKGANQGADTVETKLLPPWARRRCRSPICGTILFPFAARKNVCMRPAQFCSSLNARALRQSAATRRTSTRKKGASLQPCSPPFYVPITCTCTRQAPSPRSNSRAWYREGEVRHTYTKTLPSDEEMESIDPRAITNPLKGVRDEGELPPWKAGPEEEPPRPLADSSSVVPISSESDRARRCYATKKQAP